MLHKVRGTRSFVLNVVRRKGKVDWYGGSSFRKS